MKALSMVILLCSMVFLGAQDRDSLEDWNYVKPFKFGFKLAVTDMFPLGNKFLKETYNIKPGFYFGTRNMFMEKAGFDIEYYYNNGEVKNQSLVGHFDNGQFSLVQFSLFYRQALADKFDLEGLIGFSRFNILHRRIDERYRLAYQYFTLGTALYVDLDDRGDFQAFFRPEYLIMKSYEQDYPENYKDFFDNSNALRISLGVQFTF